MEIADEIMDDYKDTLDGTRKMKIDHEPRTEVGDYEQVIAIHSRELRRFGGAPGFAMKRCCAPPSSVPMNKWQYEEAES